jgi:hypothetical protein
MIALVSTLSENEVKIVEKYMLSTIAIMNEFTNELNNKK